MALTTEPLPDGEHTPISPSRTTQALSSGQLAAPTPAQPGQPSWQPNPRITRALSDISSATLQSNPRITRALPDISPATLQPNPRVTRTLPDISQTLSMRVPVVIKGEMKKVVPPSPLPPPVHKKRRRLVSLVGVLILLLISSLALLSATPLGHEIGFQFNALTGSKLVTGQNPTLNGLIAQATATAVYHRQNDGYDPYYGNGQTLTSGKVSLNWPEGQCTYWANSRYYALTGNWVAWSGNADQWVVGAQKSTGWHVSSAPHVPSIIVLMPGTQGASSYGHVAVVESADGNTVHTSNMNWYANGGGFNIVSHVDFTAGSGVYFVWHD